MKATGRPPASADCRQPPLLSRPALIRLPAGRRNGRRGGRDLASVLTPLGPVLVVGSRDPGLPRIQEASIDVKRLCVCVCVAEACVLSRSPPAGGLWSEQLPPHLHRNKQLEDALRRRDEEMGRLRDENDKLRRFLDRSSGDLNQKLSADRTRNLNRNRPYHVGRFQNSARRHLQVTKHVCRNLSSEFSSTEFSSDESGTAASEPAPDLWVLRTLGLKDPATVDTSSPLTRKIESHRSDFSHEGPQSPPAFSASTPNRSGPPPGHLFPEETRFGQAPFSDPVPNWSRTPQTPCRVNCPEGGRPDLAFAMSLSPASSVKTLSYPQGQAFVRTDPKGGYNFTWLPTHTSRNQDLGGGLDGPRKPQDLRLLHGT
ncbi:geminin coiled-coil domain-containing protein 1 [Phyllopteryx taeniolatus]|uniref:geminin coiled-coil domain-containing protein 1 n=1 Tax=Phyllopteryx taeniolatus TaxID=161469 RepID=UPI002AD3B769|nr:geminin coiled-coil domain-containing protein 1 [Phyllopteryx taeniolatus]